MYKKLTIVSDTAIFLKDDKYYAFEPVVNELESFEHFFDEIVWIGFDRPDKKEDLSMKQINLGKIKFVLLKEVGGKSVLSSLNILVHYPLMFFIVFKNIFKADVIHTRAPSHPAFIATLISFTFRKKIWWHKFAGSWDSSTLPFFYNVQKNVLEKAKHTKVTINGFWENQPNHCISFENPCLDGYNISMGKTISNLKLFDAPFVFCFVGRIEEAKGILYCIEALKKISPNLIQKVHFVGDGDLLDKCKEELSFLENKVVFHGFLNKVGVHEILKSSHFLLLPSKSEGFPKVIAEAACYGVIPVTSNVGSISHYINDKNGFLWDIKSKINYFEVLLEVTSVKSDILKEKSNSVIKLAESFTFEAYYKKVGDKILKKNK